MKWNPQQYLRHEHSCAWLENDRTTRLEGYRHGKPLKYPVAGVIFKAVLIRVGTHKILSSLNSSISLFLLLCAGIYVFIYIIFAYQPGVLTRSYFLCVSFPLLPSLRRILVLASSRKEPPESSFSSTRHSWIFPAFSQPQCLFTLKTPKTGPPLARPECKTVDPSESQCGPPPSRRNKPPPMFLPGRATATPNDGPAPSTRKPAPPA